MELVADPLREIREMLRPFRPMREIREAIAPFESTFSFVNSVRTIARTPHVLDGRDTSALAALRVCEPIEVAARMNAPMAPAFRAIEAANRMSALFEPMSLAIDALELLDARELESPDPAEHAEVEPRQGRISIVVRGTLHCIVCWTRPAFSSPYDEAEEGFESLCTRCRTWARASSRNRAFVRARLEGRLPCCDGGGEGDGVRRGALRLVPGGRWAEDGRA